jgi:hypothetical protein
VRWPNRARRLSVPPFGARLEDVWKMLIVDFADFAEHEGLELLPTG